MPKILSAIDAVSPAFEQTKRQLFQPFRLSFWSRMAIVALTTGDFSFSGAGGGAPHGNFSIPAGQGGQRALSALLSPPEIWQHWTRYLPYILIGAAVLIGFFIVWLYMASVFRFILFDSVLTGRCEIKPGWRRWQAAGVSYFFWQIGFGLVVLSALAAAVLAPLLYAARAGLFRDARSHILQLALGGAGLAFVLILLALAAAVVALFAKDFVIPVMAMEDVRVMEGWRRFLPMLRAEKKSFAGYVLMKIVLAVGCAIIFGILTFIALILMLIPLGLAGFAVYLIVKSYGFGWNLYNMIGTMAVASALVFLLFYVVAFISAPGVIFFQSFVNHFLGSRYPRLGARVFNEPAAPGSSAPEPSPAG